MKYLGYLQLWYLAYSLIFLADSMPQSVVGTVFEEGHTVQVPFLCQPFGLEYKGNIVKWIQW